MTGQPDNRSFTHNIGSGHSIDENWRRTYHRHVACGALDPAEKMVSRILLQSSSAIADLKNLAADFVESRQLPAAEPIFNIVLKKEPDNPSIHFYLGMIAHGRKETSRAIGHLEAAAAGRPDWPEIHFNLGIFRHETGQYDKAVISYKKALCLKPDWPAALKNLGLSFMSLEQYPEAANCFSKALLASPTDGQSHFLVALLYQRLGKTESAIAQYQQALRCKPDMLQAHINLSNCYLERQQWDNAVGALRHALSLDPESAAAWFNMAHAIRATGTIDEILSCYRKAAEFNPDWDSAHYNLAVTLRKMKRLPEAIDHSLRALKLNPQYDKAWVNLLMTAQHACDWPLLAHAAEHVDRITLKELQTGKKACEDPMLSLRRHADPRQNMKIARSWSSAIAHETDNLRDRPVFNHLQEPRQRLRIGYLSNDFKDHAVAHQIRGMLAAHDRRQFEIFGYACNPDDGTRYRRLISRACDCFKDIHAFSNPSAAQQIHEDRIDILVDLAGHTFGNRLQIAALRPAPVQVSYLGFLGTSGASFIDYVLTDSLVVPEKDSACYTEKPVYLPYCFQANDNQLPISDIDVTRAMFNLPSEGFIFCCFNQPYKIEPELFGIWMKILKSVDGSVLWLLDRNKLTRHNLIRSAKEAGVSPDRLIFSGPLSLEQHLARLKLADLALDTFTYNGGATTSNALWAGLPVLAAMGRHWVSRMSASLLRAIGLPELIASSPDDYLQMAIDLAGKPDRLRTLKQKLHHQRLQAPLFNTKLFTTHLEKAYRVMYDRFQNNLPPASFHVQP